MSSMKILKRKCIQLIKSKTENQYVVQTTNTFTFTKARAFFMNILKPFCYQIRSVKLQVYYLRHN